MKNSRKFWSIILGIVLVVGNIFLILNFSICFDHEADRSLSLMEFFGTFIVAIDIVFVIFLGNHYIEKFNEWLDKNDNTPTPTA